MVLTVDRDHCLLLYPLPDWEEIERKLVKLPSFSKPARRLQRLLIGHATECELDATGRILLSPPLRSSRAGEERGAHRSGKQIRNLGRDRVEHAPRQRWLEQSGSEDEGDMPPDMGSLSLKAPRWMVEHVPVLLEEALQALKLRENGIYVDATCGRGGHPGDPGAVGIARPRARVRSGPGRGDGGASAPCHRSRLDLQHAPFSQLQSLLTARGLHGHVHGILFDLGVSSPQLDAAARFQLPARWPARHAHGPDRRHERRAVAAFRCRRRNRRVLHEYGEERYARRIARANRACPRRISDRHHAPARRGYARAVPTRERSKDPATRSFKAIRIFINHELDELRQVLPQAVARNRARRTARGDQFSFA